MNKSASPRRIINTCLPAHRYNCMLMTCTSATCCRLLNAEYNAIQVHCEDVRTRSKVCWKESWLPSVIFTWNIDEVNLWIDISASPPKKLLTLSLCSLLKRKDAAHPVELCFRINSKTWPVLWLWCGRCWFTTVTTFVLLFLVWEWRCTQWRLSFDCQLSHLIMKSHWRQGEIWLCKSKRCFSLLSSTIICASHTAKNKNILTKSKGKHESSLKVLYYSNYTSPMFSHSTSICFLCVRQIQLMTESKIYCSASLCLNKRFCKSNLYYVTPISHQVSLPSEQMTACNKEIVLVVFFGDNSC